MRDLRISRRSVAFLATMLLTVAVASATTWVVLSEQAVNGRADHDTIVVT